MSVHESGETARAGDIRRRTTGSDGGRHRGPHEASAVHPDRSADPDVDDEALDAVLGMAPRGALALGAMALGTMLIAWLALYVFVFLARGPIA